MKVLAKSTGTITLATCSVCWRHGEGISMYWYMSWTVLMLHIILCYVPVLGEWLLLMKDSGGERMHYPYGECILSPTDFDVGSECWDSVCTHIGWRCLLGESVRSPPKLDLGSVDACGWRQLSHSCRWCECLEGDLERWVCAIDVDCALYI